MIWLKRNPTVSIIVCLLVLLVGTPAFSFFPKEATQLTFAVIGDSGTGKTGQYAVARQMKATYEKNRFEFVLMLGDNIYSNGNAKHFKKKFELPYEPLLDAGVKFYASLGNHDVRRGREAQLNYDKFNMNGQSYYSFAQGDVEFFALDSTRMNAEQIAWIEAKLKASTARWKVAFFHHPLYSSGKRHGSEMNLRGVLEPLFTRFGVNAVFSGHDHFYERIKPQQGVQYFVQGASGQLRKNGMKKKTHLTAASNDVTHSFLLVRANAAEMQVEAISETGEVIDKVTIPAFVAAQTMTR
ncbi:MAG: metallophosphoesterase [Blastocatellia bacterium]|nr:metallophosphoesterase [Blastocatellia bacterium]